VKICENRTTTGREKKDGKREESGIQRKKEYQPKHIKEREQQTKRQKEMA
jgi:hypothetical protein